MKYDARVTVIQIAYQGNNIGRNIRINLTINGKSTMLSLALTAGDSRNLNKLVYNEEVQSNRITINASASATEKDPVHDDPGSGSATLDFGTQNSDAIMEIELQGDPKGDKGKKATLIITLSGILRETGERYVSFVAPEGWLKIKNEDQHTYPNVIPFALSVNVTSNDGIREYFEVQEGKMKDWKASVKLKDDGSSFLQRDNPQTSSVIARFSKRDAVLTIDGYQERYWAVIDSGNPTPNGTYDLELPYELHTIGSAYRSRAAYARTWFRIGHSGDRFLHAGSISAGCVTIRQIERWDEICGRIITSRKGDMRNVGQIVVTQ